MSQQTENVMRKIYINKVVLNIGTGKSGQPIETAKAALSQIINGKPNERAAKKTQRDWGVRKGEPIAVAITIRGDNATPLLKKLLDAKGNQIKKRSFDDEGNFSFGISEHIDIPGIKYDHKIGILGLNVSVSLNRFGFSVKIRSKHKAKIGKEHRITSNDAIEFMTKEFGVKII
jgi:large subunit ribosomal protein L5